MARNGRWCPLSRAVGSAAGVFAVAVLAIAPALACTPTANVELNPSRGEPGSVITVSGSVFDPGGAPVEIRWGGTAGDILGRTGVSEAGQFSLSLNVPRAAPGHYIVSAIQKLNDGGYKRSAASFEVPGSAPDSRTPASPSGDQPVTEPKNEQPAPADATTPADSSSVPAVNPAQPSAAAPAPQPKLGVSRATSPVRTIRPKATPATPNTEPSTAAAAPASDAHAAIAAEPLESSVLPMAAVGDLWSGFGAGASPGLATGGAAPPSATAEGNSAALWAGAGLMGLAMVMMFVAAVPAIHRRRSMRTSPTMSPDGAA